jgi:hypothetical protein
MFCNISAESGSSIYLEMVCDPRTVCILDAVYQWTPRVCNGVLVGKWMGRSRADFHVEMQRECGQGGHFLS